MAMHGDQLRVTRGSGLRLIGEQFPQWQARSVQELPTVGTVNAIYRIGDALTARFPLRMEEPQQVLALLQAEASAADELAEVTPVPTPKPVAIGQPGDGYPLPWSDQTWLPGHDATVEDPAGSVAFANDLAAFISCLRAADTSGRTFSGAGRGGHLPHPRLVDRALLGRECRTSRRGAPSGALGWTCVLSQ